MGDWWMLLPEIGRRRLKEFVLIIIVSLLAAAISQIVYM